MSAARSLLASRGAKRGFPHLQLGLHPFEPQPPGLVG